MQDFASPTYPYSRDFAQNTLRGAEDIPYKMLIYLLDLPDANGYLPVDDNDRPRVRFAKYVWNDGARPLSGPLPTPEQKRSLIFDPDAPDLNTDEEKAAHPKGYRLLWQRIRGQSILEAQTIVKCYIGRIFENGPFITTLGVRFDITTNVNFETNTRTNAYARSFDIEQSIREALAGVNMTGIGTISFSRLAHPDNGSTYLYDDGQNIGRTLHCSVDWADAGAAEITGACEDC